MIVLATSGCTDAALVNQPIPPPSDSVRDTGAEVDGGDTTDTFDIPDVSCTSNEECRALVGGLPLCDEAFCSPNTGRCEVARRPDCCLGDAECPALGDPCLQNRCPVPGGPCIALDTCASCTFDSDCDLQAPVCTSGRCSEGLCVYAPLPTCCVDASDCDDADICTSATCEAGLCVHRATPPTPDDGCCRTPPVIQTTFSPAPDFEAVANVTDAGWFIRQTNFTPSPPAALVLGNRSSPFNVSNERPHFAEARFRIGPARPGSIEVKFQIYLDIRQAGDVDRFRVTLVSASGAERLVYAKNVATFGAWHPVKRSVLVDEVGPWTLVFTFDAVTSDPERRVGIYVDDLSIRTACGGELCGSDRDCATNDLCLVGRCLGGECRFSPNPACAECQVDAQCADASVCTDDRCLEGRCVGFPVPGCCSSDRDCDDGDRCTLDRCRVGPGLCFYERDPSCETCTPPGCDDGDPCTRDVCTPNGCLNSRDPALPGCGACNIDRDCDDNNVCTVDTCENGVCRNRFDASLPGCSGGCTGDDQCPPSTTCEISFCDVAAGRCVLRPLPGCCTGVADCNDGRICTEDSCTTDGRCLHQLRPGCCESNAQCNDGNACTADVCNLATGSCSFTPSPDCCTANGQCNDNDACTRDVCENGRCTFSPIPNCCTANSQCNDNNACTTDACINGQCSFVPIPNCCTSAAQCNDNNACTADACVNGQCTRTPIAGCCSANSQCNDDDACTADSCVDGVCRFGPIANCCTANSQCNDNDACTADACVDNQCTRTPIANCCTANSQCNDNDACTTDACVNNQCTFTPNGAPGCTPTGCTSDAQCEDGALCTANQCFNGQCRTLPILGCCQSAADCNDNDACTNDLCLAGGVCFFWNRTCNDNNPCTLDRCDPVQGCVFTPDPSCVCTPTTLWSRSFSPTETADIEIDGSGFGIQWRVDPVLAFSPTQALRYGKADGSDYANGFRTFGRATGPSLAVSPAANGVRLEFRVWVDIDRTPDSFRARVLFGQQNVIVWDHVELEQLQYRQWIPVSVALPAAAIGQDIRIRFVFDSVDGNGNSGQGVAVDDIVVRTTCP